MTSPRRWASPGTGGGRSAGCDSGERIVAILYEADLIQDDVARMSKVVGYVKRQRAQQSRHEPIESSRWRYSLMKWGQDPLKK